MAHHIFDFNNIEWVNNFENCILLRHPKEVISSYSKKNKLDSAEELGYPQQYEIIKYLKKMDIKVFNGLNMFIYQGQKAFYLWNKINPEIDEKLIELLVTNLK